MVRYLKKHLILQDKTMMHTRKPLPSWTGGVPRQMSEAILARRGGGFPTDRNLVIQSEARDLHHPVSRHSLRSVWIHPSWTGGESLMGENLHLKY
jgi:hypothetical protein